MAVTTSKEAMKEALKATEKALGENLVWASNTKNRKQAAEFISEQLSTNGTYEYESFLFRTRYTGRNKGRRFHYGKQELRDLLDFLFGEPKDDSEELK